MADKLCLNCGEAIEGRGTKYCCQQCHYEYKAKIHVIIKECPVCHKMFPTNKGRINTGRGKHCSPECARVTYNLNKEERGKKISIANKGREITWADKISKTLTGNTLTEETKIKISKGCKITLNKPEIKIKCARPGKLNGNYREDSHREYCELWTPEFRNRVRAYFGYVCANCLLPQSENKTKSGKLKLLSVHHVNYEKDACCKENESVNDRLFVPLCNVCHSKSGSNRDYWMNRFYELIHVGYGGKCYFTKEEMSSQS